MKTTLRLRSVSVANSTSRTTKSIRIPKKIGTSRSLSRLFRSSVLLTLLTLLTFNCFANNVYITNVAYNAGTNPGKVTFQISWDNSWYTSTMDPYNYDAVWVFVKYQKCTSGSAPYTSPWVHAGINTTSGTHSISCNSSCPGVSLTVDAVTDGKGVFIRRNSAGAGKTEVWNCSLQLTSPPNTAGNCPAGSCNWKVFGVEMVYVAQNSFFVGDGDGLGSTTNPMNDAIGSPNASLQIISEAAVGAGALYTGSPALAGNYPKGFYSFYCMKHELSQAEYVNFINSLQFLEQMNRVTTPPDQTGALALWALTTLGGGPYNRNGVKESGPGINWYVPATYAMDLDNDATFNETAADGLNLSCNYISWMDLCAFLDWAGLRPMTEMEYEKVCRGTLASVLGEYPWGSTALTAATSGALTNGGNTTEISAAFPANGLSVHNGVAGNGPIRQGASAGSTTNRVSAAAAYYGALDMAGNVWEQLVSVESVNAAGNAFQGTLGDGTLCAVVGYEGNAVGNTDWPGVDATTTRGVTGAAGSGTRGGSWFTQTAAANQLRTSDRTNAIIGTSTRDKEFGGRGVRQYP